MHCSEEIDTAFEFGKDIVFLYIVLWYCKAIVFLAIVIKTN